MSLKTVTHSDEFAASYDALKHKHRGFLEVLIGVEWGVASDPDQFPCVPDCPDHRFAFTDSREDGTPCFRFLFEVDEGGNVELLDVDEIPTD